MIERILQLISQSGKSDYSIEHTLGFTQGTISNWRRSKNKVSTEAIVKLANYFNVSTDYLLCLTDAPTPLNWEQGTNPPSERPENDLATIDNIKALLAENDGIDFIERLYKELQEKQKIFVITWLIGYMVSEGLPVNKIMKK